MSWIKKKNSHGKNRNYSILNKLEREGIINQQFQLMMNRLTLEEVIAVKLELAGKSSGGSIYGIPVWFSITDIVTDAVLKFALSSTRTMPEAARFVGINFQNFKMYLKRYKTKSYFDQEISPL